MHHAPIRPALVIATALALPFLPACGGDDPIADQPVTEAASDAAPERSATSEIAPGLVSPTEAAQLAADGIAVIDVRTPEEYADGHIQGATLVNFYDESFADQIATLDPDRDYLVYCRSGNRSGQAVALMEQLGFEHVYDLDGGVVAFDAAGLPLVD